MNSSHCFIFAYAMLNGFIRPVPQSGPLIGSICDLLFVGPDDGILTHAGRSKTRDDFSRLKFIRENIFKANFQLYQNGFQLVQSQAVLAFFNAKECLVGNANFFGELGIGKLPPFFAEELCQLPIQVALHA